MADRARFLEAIRERTGRYKPTRAPDVAWTPKNEPLEAPEIEDPPARFLEELEKLGAHGERVESLEEAREYILSLVRKRKAKLLIRWDVAELEEMDLEEVEVVVWRDLGDFRDVAGRADIGLSTADYAIAETGSLVLTSGPGRGRTVTLLPPVYVALVPTDRVLSTVSEAIERYSGEGALPANVCFHTGPSKSGDIEMTLSVGVHGPGEVHVVLVG